MGTFFQTMAYPFAACLVLTGIHVYLGIHVITRKVIFVDLALATIAALGAVWGALLGWDVSEDALVIKGFSLVFTFAGAAIFALTRTRQERVPHDAIIGITYAVALAAIILGSAKLPHGAEEVRDLQAGSILWISGSTIAWTALLYVVIGVFHYAFRRQFLAISRDPEKAAADGLNVRFWDFLFYVSFGFVVTSSVSIAGVLLVFSYLVIPAVVAVLFADGVRARLVIGWTVGTLVSALGVVISYQEDLPSGPVIVVCFGLFLAVAGMGNAVRRAEQREVMAVKMVAVTLSFLAFIGISTFFRHTEEVDVFHLLETGTNAEQLEALHEFELYPILIEEGAPQLEELLGAGALEVRLELLRILTEFRETRFLDAVLDLLEDPDDVIRERALKYVRALDDPSSVSRLLAAAEAEPDEYLRLDLADAVLALGDPRGIATLLDVMDTGEAEQARGDAFAQLCAYVDPQLPFAADAEPVQHADEIEALRAWWKERGSAPLPVKSNSP